LAAPVAGWVSVEPARTTGWLADLLMLTKARANIAVVATAFVGFALHADISSNWVLLFHTLVGTALLAASASVANQAIEHRFDRGMERTRNRPIAANRLSRHHAILLSGAMSAAGCLWLGAGVNARALLFGVLAFLIYVFAYTPLKRHTPACTLVGAVSGALPVLIGWAATDAKFGLWSAVLFAVLFLWQMPHFLAITWWHRTDYLGAGYKVLCHDDRRGRKTAVGALAFAIALFAVSLIPALAHQVSSWYWLGAVAAGILFCSSSIRFLIRRTDAAARSLFLASLYYLPTLFALMLLCRARS
jgi:protoheme IX farnesyltransferase